MSETQSVPSFSALGSNASDVLDAYPSRGFAVSTSVPTSNNYVASSSFTKKDGKVAGKLGLWFKSDNLVFDYSWGTNNKCHAGAEVEVANTKVHLSVQTNKDGESTILPSVAYANEKVSVDVATDYAFDKRKLGSVKAQTVLQYPENVYWGASVSVDTADQAVKGKGTVEVDNGASQTSFSVKRSSGACTLGYSWFHQYSDSLAYAALLSLDVCPDDRKGAFASVGASWKLDDNTQLSGKWSVGQAPRDAAQFRAAFAAEQKVASHCVATIGVDLNASKFLGRADATGGDHTFGFNLSFE